MANFAVGGRESSLSAGYMKRHVPFRYGNVRFRVLRKTAESLGFLVMAGAVFKENW